MDFLKSLFGEGEALTYDQLLQKAQTAGINAVNLSEGRYVSIDKFNDKVNALTQQVTDLNGQIAKRDTDITALQETLTAAQADATKLAEAQNALTDLQGKYAQQKTDYETKLSRQTYEYRIREEANKLKFSSTSAKKAFVQDALAQEFKQDGETLLGYNDFVTKYKTEDPTAFAPEEPAKPPKDDPDDGAGKPPQIVLPTGTKGNDPSGKDTGGFQFNFSGVRPKSDK